MRLLCNIVMSAACLLHPYVAVAQDFRDILSKAMQDSGHSCVTVAYEFSTVVDEVRFEDRGVIELQDGMWHLKGDSLEIYTDGQATWVLDPDSMEAIVEPAWTMDDLEGFYDSAVSASVDTDIVVLSTETSEKKPVLHFTPSFSEEWIVTDLR